MAVHRFQRWLYPIQTLLGILMIAVSVVDVPEATDERAATFRVLMMVVAVGLTLTGAIGWIITSRERRRQ